MKVKRSLLRLILIFFSAILVGIVAVAVYAWHNRVELAQNQLTKLFKSEVTVEDVDVRLFAHFPATGIELVNLRVKGTNKTKPSEVIFAQKAEAVINIWGLVTNKKQKYIDYVGVDSCQLNLVTDTNYVSNFDLFKGDPNNPNKPDLVQIEKLSVKNTNIRYQFLPKKQDYNLTVYDGAVKLISKPGDIRFIGDVVGQSHYLDVGQFKIMDERPFTADADVQLTKADKHLTFRTSKVTIANTPFELDGWLTTGKAKEYDVRFKSDHANIETLLSFVPEKAVKQLKLFDADGLLSFRGLLKGKDTETENPHFELKFKCLNASVFNVRSKTRFSGLMAAGFFSNGSQNNVNTTYLIIDTISGSFAEKPFSGYVKLSQFKDLHIDSRLHTILPFKALGEYAGLTLEPGASGFAYIDARMKGYLRHLTSFSTIDSLDYGGQIKLVDLSGKATKYPLTFDKFNMLLTLKGSSMNIERFSGGFNGQQLNGSATFPHFTAFITKVNPHLKGDINLNVNNLDVQGLMRSLVPQQPAAQKDDKTKFNGDFTLSDIWDLKLNLRLDNPKYGNLRFDNLKATVLYRHKQITVQELDLHRGGEFVHINARIDGTPIRQNKFGALVKFQSPHVLKLLKDAGLLPANAKTDTALSGAFQMTLTGGFERGVPHKDFPDGKVTLVFEKGQFTRDFLKATDIKFKTELTAQHIFDWKHTPLKIEKIEGLFMDNPFTISLDMNNWIERQLKAQLSTKVKVESVAPHIKTKAVEQLSGIVGIKISVNERLENLLHLDSVAMVRLNGQIQVENLAGRLVKPDKTLSQLNGLINLQDRTLKIENLAGMAGKTTVQVKGQVSNYLPFALLKGQPLEGNLEVITDTLHLAEWIKPKKDSTQAPKPIKIKLPEKTNVNLKFASGHAYYKDISLYDIAADISLIDRVININNLQFASFNGNAVIKGVLDTRQADSLKLDTDLDLKDIDIRSTFAALNNFNQSFITADNIKGRLNAKINYRNVIPTTAKPNLTQGAVALVDFDVQQGELINFKPAEKGAIVFKKQHLEHIRFNANGENIRFQDGKVNLNMEVNSNIMDAYSVGTYKLDKSILTSLSLKTVARKRRTVQPAFTPTINKLRYKKTLLVFKLKGKANKIKFRYDLKASLRNLLRTLRLKSLED